MENKKLDQLFQNKLSRMESAPSDDAWKQISGELNQEKRPVIWMRIAAAILLLAVSAAVVIQLNIGTKETGEIVQGITSHPVPVESATVDLPIFEKVKTVATPQPVQQRIEQTQVAKVETNEIPEQPTFLEAPELKSINAIALLSEKKEQVHAEEVIEEPLPQLSVQITYIASNKAQDSVKTDDKTRMGRLLAKAKEITPGDMLASLRDTKNDFFNGINN